jgi:hypothetical protein
LKNDTIRKGTPEDAVVLTEISKRAFDNDVN